MDKYTFKEDQLGTARKFYCKGPDFFVEVFYENPLLWPKMADESAIVKVNIKNTKNRSCLRICCKDQQVDFAPRDIDVFDKEMLIRKFHSVFPELIERIDDRKTNIAILDILKQM